MASWIRFGTCMLAARRVSHYDSSGLVVTSAREGVCKGAQSLLAPQSVLALGRLGESESEFEYMTVHSTGGRYMYGVEDLGLSSSQLGGGSAWKWDGSWCRGRGGQQRQR